MTDLDKMSLEELLVKAYRIVDGIATTGKILIRDTPHMQSEDILDYVNAKDFLLEQAEYAQVLLDKALNRPEV